MTARARTPRYNPDLRRHSWEKLREHHKRCQFCGIHVENKPGSHRAEWHQEWTWPDGRVGNTEWSTNKKLPTCPGPTGTEITSLATTTA
ncbi:hypothetical protein [Micromonospora sp. NPDC047730]|uniref:hypothetical protein n=1 Tax=Micromonospora sp. NPDC047730 TaxID=3364253 RepID=UPI00371EDF99